MKTKPPPDSITRTADLMRRLLAVPKEELEHRAAEYRRRKKRRAKK